jgi:cytochrome P450
MLAMELTWNDLPGPTTRWWGLPALAAMRRDYLGVIATQQRFGDLVRQQIFNERAVDVFDPELLRQVMVDHADALIRWERGPEVFSDGLGQSVLVTEGAVWQRQRRMLMQAFTPRRVAGYVAQMVEAAAVGMAALRPGEVAMDGLFSHLAMDVISRTLFSAPISGNTQAAADAVQVLSETALREMFWPMTLPDWLPLPGKAAKRHARRLIQGLIQSHIDERHQHPDARKTDLLNMLLVLRDEDSGTALSTQEVFDQCVLSFQAGHETTATALLWWSWLMASHPQAQERAAAEVDAALMGRPPDADAVQALPWLTATLKEAMRLYPPVAAIMTRRLTREITLRGVRLPARTLVRVTPWLLHRDPRWWPREPEAFRPERFMAATGSAPDPILRGAYIPFGLGPRVCLGQHFAQLEMNVIAAMLLQRFRLETLTDTPPTPRLAVTLRPEGGVRLKLVARTSKLP